ncbi:glycosyltransferase family 4 protein [Candidatus Microthrix parvicella]|uniref:glycosyltransferase family 4 protein n=1 Tax=Candidatus Neomicrothrix parvicella TaxID=41950 RepID=UPI0004BBF3A0|nr:glycosyltransferase family 4 protein [Candidatus Microthrix parvicella]
MSRRSGPNRVVLLTSSLAPSAGLARWSRELVRGLEMVTTSDELTIDVLVRYRLDVGLATVEQFGLRCTLHDLPDVGTSITDRLRSVRRVGRLIASLDADVVHAPMGWLWLLGDRRFARPKVVATAHVEPSPDAFHVQDRLLARILTMRNRIRLVTNVPSLRLALDRAVGVPAGTSLCMPVATDRTGVSFADLGAPDLRAALDVQADESIVMTLSRLVSVKRLDLVLEVIEKVKAANRPVRFVICGDGPEFGALLADAQRRDLEGWIHFLGHVGDPAPLLTEADIVLNTSDSEGGMPLALIEALLAGTPVVATEAGGVVDLLEDPRDGRLVPRGNVEALFHALCVALDEPVEREERAARARGRFDLERMGRAHLALVRELVGDVT